MTSSPSPACCVVALLVGYLIILQQQRLRIPVLEEKPFELKAEFETAQAVTPGQGQTVRVAGVRIGDISKVELEDGNAVVTMDIDRKFLPIYQDATILLRPKTGLKDMFLELDPGTAGRRASSRRATRSRSPTPRPRSTSTRSSRRSTPTPRPTCGLLLIGGGEGLKGRGKDLGEVLGSLGPINRELARLNSEVAKRKENLAHLIHNFNILFGRVGEEDEEIAALIDSSNAALGAIAEPGPQRAARDRRCSGRRCSDDARSRSTRPTSSPSVLGPTSTTCGPFARNLEPINESLGAARSRRPATTSRTRSGPSCAPPASRSATCGRPRRTSPTATPRLTDVGEQAQQARQHGRLQPERRRGARAPPGRDEGYLYWLGWLSHIGNSIFQAQDAHGVYRRIYLTASCETLLQRSCSQPRSRR